jgi:hypothetical protein
VATPPASSKGSDLARPAAKKHRSAARVFWRLRRSRTTSNVVVWTAKIAIHVVASVAVGLMLAVAWASAGFVVCQVAAGHAVAGPCVAVRTPSGEVIRSAYAWLVKAGILVGVVAYSWHWVAASSSYEDRPWRLRERFDRVWQKFS